MSENTDPTPQEAKQITDAARIEAFLTDPIIEQAVLKLERSYFDGFKSSKTADERSAFGFKGSVLDDLLLELRKVVNAGVVAKVNVERRQRRSSK